MSEPIHGGSCLCGTVAYAIAEPYKTLVYCHCSRCRKVSGSAHASNLFVPVAQFRWLQGEEQVGRFKLPEAKSYSSAFCKTCGSSLPWSAEGSPIYVVPVGTLNDDPGVRPRRSIYWGSRPEWYLGTAELELCDELPQRK